jgi:hypothetical protein
VRMAIRMAGAVVIAAALGFYFASGVRAHEAGKAAVYDTATESSVSGTLAQPPESGRMGLYLSVQQSGGAMVDVRVAPRRYLASRGFSLQQGDELEITGSKVMLRGAPVLLAREIRKQGKTLPLRDRTGRPLWR